MLTNLDTQEKSLNKHTHTYLAKTKGFGIFTRLFNDLARHFKHRQTLKELQLKSDETLQDIGIDRISINRELGKFRTTKFDNIGW